MRLLAALGLLLLSGCAVSSQHTPHYRSMTLYTCAHPDDCQLFMNPNLQKDIALKSNKVVMVYVTAGDAGKVKKDRKHSISYWDAREQGALEATRWLADIGREPEAEALENKETITLAGRPVTRYHYDNTVSYFLRLPDGMGDGNGNSATGKVSLKKLNTLGSGMDSVDGSAHYANWKELVGTLRALVEQEAAGIPSITANFQDPDPAINQGDHSDHTYTGLLTLDAISPHPCISTTRFRDYITNQEAPNLDPDTLLTDAGAFAVMSATIGKAGYKNTWDKVHHSWLGRNYFTYTPSFQNCLL
jgi:LmbE family N-acetylglucosaminyl deacetylase